MLERNRPGRAFQEPSRTIPSGFPSAVREPFGYARLPEPLDRRREEHRARPTLRGRARALRTFLAHIQDHHVSMAGPDRSSTLTGSRVPNTESSSRDGSSDQRACRLSSVPRWLPNGRWETGWNGCEGVPARHPRAAVSQARRRRFPGSGLPVRSARAAGFRSGACGAEVTGSRAFRDAERRGVTDLAAADHPARLVARSLTAPRSRG